MKNIKTTYVLAVLIALFYSCETEIVFSEKNSNPYLVVNSFLENDSIIELYLYQTTSINSPVEKVFVKNAVVNLFEDDIEQEPLILKTSLLQNQNYENNGNLVFDTIYYYSCQTIAKIGKTYRFKISAPNFKSVSSETTIPSPVEILSIDTSSFKKDNGNWIEYQNNYTIRFKDPEDEVNYYRLTKSTTNGDYRTDVQDTTIGYIQIYSYSSNYFNSDDPIMQFGSDDANSYIMGSSYNSYGIFTDLRINGQEYELKIYESIGYSNDYVNQTDYSKGEFESTTFVLQSITRETYLFLKSIEEQEFNDGIPFVEPVPVFSNIENGVGIISGFSSTSKGITIGEYPMEGVEYINNN